MRKKKAMTGLIWVRARNTCVLVFGDCKGNQGRKSSRQLIEGIREIRRIRDIDIAIIYFYDCLIILLYKSLNC